MAANCRVQVSVLYLPKQTHGTPVHRVAVWLQSQVQGTSYHCRSPELSLRLPSEPWRRHSTGRGSCSGVRWAGLGYLLWTETESSKSQVS